jgi:hypothetical protein
MKKLAILTMKFVFTLSVADRQAQKDVNEKVKESNKELKNERVALRKLEGTTEVKIFADVPAKDQKTALLLCSCQLQPED